MKKIKGFSKGVSLIASKILQGLKNKNIIFVAVTGISGSGKSEFVHRLKGLLGNKKIGFSSINTDNFYKPGTRELNIKKLHQAIRNKYEKFEATGGIVIVDSVHAFDNEVFTKPADLKVYLHSPFWECLFRRLVRDSRNGRVKINDRLKQVVTKTAAGNYSLKKIKNKIPEKSSVDYLIYNDYVEAGNPQIYISNSNLCFLQNNHIRGKVEVTPQESKKLQKIGIKLLKNDNSE